MTSRPVMPPLVVRRFEAAWNRASELEVDEPTAVVLATADARGRPSTRTVLLKAWDERGFVFYTNLGSRKAQQLAENPRGALTFYWGGLREQVQVEGDAVPVSAAEADAYWASRSRASRIGAWASRQSEKLVDAEALTRRVEEMETRFIGIDPPRPDFWSGFRLVPDRIEFWEGRPHRLHAREVWIRGERNWNSRLLAP